jgi:hypothetical protein
MIVCTFESGGPKMSLRVLLLMAAASVQTALMANSEVGQPQIPDVRVWVINAARVDERTLSTALSQASEIFRDAGIRLTWLECPSPAIQGGKPSGCFVDDPGVLFVRILSKTANNRGVLGSAFVNSKGSLYATVFWNRVLEVAIHYQHCPKAMLLGHVIAHELGHLLLGISAHAGYGLMAGCWGDTIERAAVGALQFSPAEASRMRAEAFRRGQ